MTTFTLTFNQTLCQKVTILANSKEEYKEAAAKLLSFLESSSETKTLIVNDQVLEVKTEYVVIDKMFEDED